MRWTKTHSAASIAAVACATLAYLGFHLLQDDPTLQTASVAPHSAAVVGGTSSPALPAVEPGVKEYLSSCSGVSPFVKSANCYPEPEQEANGGPATDGSAPMLPRFENVYVVGFVGEGVAAKALRSAGRPLTGTASNNDSILVDISTGSTDAPVLTSITKALEEGKFVIIDGGDTKAGSHKLNEIMADINLLKVEGVTAYGVSKEKDGTYHVTPLQSLALANGERQFDQLHNVLGIKKPGSDS